MERNQDTSFDAMAFLDLLDSSASRLQAPHRRAACENPPP
jgi:hypothetical protein